MPWPLPEKKISAMLSVVDEVLVIEEKRSFVEEQIAKICLKQDCHILLSGKTTLMVQIYYHHMASYHLRIF